MITKIIDEKAIREAKVLIDRAEHIVAICHNSPDGDAVGSCLAATIVLGELGTKAKIQDAKSLSMMKCSLAI